MIAHDGEVIWFDDESVIVHDAPWWAASPRNRSSCPAIAS